MNWRKHPVRAGIAALCAVFLCFGLGFTFLKYVVKWHVLEDVFDFAPLFFVWVIALVAFCGLMSEPGVPAKRQLPKDAMRLKVISPIVAEQVVMPTGPDRQLHWHGGHEYRTGTVLLLLPHERDERNRITQWMVRAEGHPDMIVADQVLKRWRAASVQDVAEAA
ncbi:MAG: hypothetical protein JO019_05075 [Candidatus Kaiserbacteria bacterium]|nr:hypothetical protein [Candidatus Kaiserbacteria bacterium]